MTHLLIDDIKQILMLLLIGNAQQLLACRFSAQMTSDNMLPLEPNSKPGNAMCVERYTYVLHQVATACVLLAQLMCRQP
jgi:hypothetical protein